MRRKLTHLTYLLSSVAIAGFAQISNLQVVGTTSTQAVITYTAPDNSDCLVDVYVGDEPGGPRVNDVNPDIFNGSRHDSRRGSFGRGTIYRAFVIGQRSSELATAGPYKGIRHYSRALEANTTHFVHVSCGSYTAHTTFTTTNIPLGNTYPDQWFHDRENAGDQPFPESLGDSSQVWSFIDPLTGMYLQDVSQRGDVDMVWSYPPSNPLFSAHNVGQYPCDSTGPWVSPCSALAVQGYNNPPECRAYPCAAAGYASIANSTAWLILPIDMNQSLTGGIYGGTAYSYGDVLNQVQVTLYGYVSAATENNQVDVCLSMNGGASCASSILTVALPAGAPGTQVTVGQADPTQSGMTAWLMDSNPRINRPELQRHQGSVNVSGNTLTWVSGDTFSTYWFTGGNGTIWLSSTQAGACQVSSATQYPLASMLDGNNITVEGKPASGKYYYCAQNGAIMIRRHAADNNTAYVQGVSMQAVAATPTFTPDDGQSTACLNSKVNGGFFCNIGGLFWVNPVTGSTSWFGVPQLGQRSAADSWRTFTCPFPGGQAGWDQTKSTPTWYCGIQDSTFKTVIIMAQYSLCDTNPAQCTAPPARPRQGQYFGSQIGTYPEDVTCQGTYSQYCISYGNGALVMTDITPSSLGLSVTDQTAKFDSAFNPAQNQLCPSASGMVVQQGIILLACNSSQGQNTPGWVIAVDPGDGNPTHAGTPQGPHVIGAASTTSSPVTRWGGLHSIHDFGEQPYFGFSADVYSQMINTTSTVIPAAGGQDCGAYGGTPGQTCVAVSVNPYEQSLYPATTYEPYLQYPKPPFVGSPGELGPAQAQNAVAPPYTGDQAAFGNPSGEVMTLIAKNWNNTPGLWIWQRSHSEVPACGLTTIYYRAKNNGEIWNPKIDPHGLTPLVDQESTGGHGYYRDGSAGEAFDTGSLTCSNSLFDAYQTRLGNWLELATAPVAYVAANPTFAGSCFGLALPNDAQSHPNPSGALAAPDCGSRGQAPCGFDVRPQLGEKYAPPFTRLGTTGTLYASTWGVIDPDDLSYYYQQATSQLNRKLVSTAASCGPHPLTDISGPQSHIDDSPENNYKYCVSRVDGECYSGSQVGQFFVNCPDVIEPDCADNSGYLASQGCNPVTGGCVLAMGNDICVSNGSAPAQKAVQYALGENEPTGQPGALSRNLTTAVGRVRMTSGFANARLLPDNSWILFVGSWLNMNGGDLWMGKMPPTPVPDSYNRSAFIPLAVQATPPAGMGITNAYVQFGYLENGPAVRFYCTSRQETCVTTATSGAPLPDPAFTYAVTEPIGNGVPCAAPNGCTIYIPALPQHVVYYSVAYRNAANAVVAISESAGVSP